MVRKLAKRGYNPSQTRKFNPYNAADAIFTSERRRRRDAQRPARATRRTGAPVHSAFGTRVAVLQSANGGRDLVACYCLLAENPEGPAHSSSHAYVGNLLFAAGDPQSEAVLFDLFFKDLEHQAKLWSRALQGPAKLGLVNSSLSFGRKVLRPRGFLPVRSSTSADASDEPVLYTHSYDLEG